MKLEYNLATLLRKTETLDVEILLTHWFVKNIRVTHHPYKG